MVDLMRLKPEWRKIYGALPREVVYKKENNYTYILAEH